MKIEVVERRIVGEQGGGWRRKGKRRIRKTVNEVEEGEWKRETEGER